MIGVRLLALVISRKLGFRPVWYVCEAGSMGRSCIMPSIWVMLLLARVLSGIISRLADLLAV